MTPDEKLKSLGLTLPSIPKPIANYVSWKLDGRTLYCSGQGPRNLDGSMITGKVGRDVTWQQAYEHAKIIGLQLLATAKQATGDLGKLEVVKVLGMVNGVPAFPDSPQVINGFSELLIEVFGAGIGRHARSAVTMAGLPSNVPVEVEVIFEID